MSRPTDDNNFEFERARYWCEKSKTAFGKRSVDSIPMWVHGVAEPRLTFQRRAQEYIYIDNETQVSWYFAPQFITFFLRGNTSTDEIAHLQDRLSHPEHINIKGSEGGPRFRAYCDADLRILKDILMDRLGTHIVNDRHQGLTTFVDDIEQPGEWPADEEGQASYKQHISYERSLRNREAAIKSHGTTCRVCGFNFDRVYGETLAQHYIEIHHLKPLSRHKGPVNPETDLIPVCANCHRMLHRRSVEPMPIEELKALLR